MTALQRLVADARTGEVKLSSFSACQARERTETRGKRTKARGAFKPAASGDAFASCAELVELLASGNFRGCSRKLRRVAQRRRYGNHPYPIWSRSLMPRDIRVTVLSRAALCWRNARASRLG